MKGLELAEHYWKDVGEPVIREVCPQALAHLAAGLVGEGSECLGYDDDISRDHDWGPKFCIWLDDEAMALYGEILSRVYQAMPDEFMGYSRIKPGAQSADREGVIRTDVFYSRFLGRTSMPLSLMDWMELNEEGISAATNGEVFYDGNGRFTRIRNQLLCYYPEDVRRKKLSGRCAKAAQSGQYNYTRCLRRGDRTAALQALAEFTIHIQAALYLLNRKYRPYYKWTNRMLRELGPEEARIASNLDALTEGDLTMKAEEIERISGRLIEALRRQGMTNSHSSFLLDHGAIIQSGISDEQIRTLPLMLV